MRFTHFTQACHYLKLMYSKSWEQLSYCGFLDLNSSVKSNEHQLALCRMLQLNNLW